MLAKLNEWILSTYLETKELSRHHFTKTWKEETGAGTVEYAMIIAVVVFMIIAATAVMDTPLRDFFEGVIDKMSGQAGV